MKTGQTLIKYLLVEDDDDHAELVAVAMEQLSDICTLDRVSDGEQALDYLYQRGNFADAIAPDMILMDLNMPKLNGFEVINRLKNDPVLKLIPIVVLTTSDADADRLKAYQLNVNSYVVKPLNFSFFQSMIKDLGSFWCNWNRLPNLDQKDTDPRREAS